MIEKHLSSCFPLIQFPTLSWCCAARQINTYAQPMNSTSCLLLYSLAQHKKKTISLRLLFVIIRGFVCTPTVSGLRSQPRSALQGTASQARMTPSWTKRLPLSKESWQSLSNLMKPLSVFFLTVGLQCQPMVTTKKTWHMKNRSLYILNATCATKNKEPILKVRTHTYRCKYTNTTIPFKAVNTKQSNYQFNQKYKLQTIYFKFNSDKLLCNWKY